MKTVQRSKSVGGASSPKFERPGSGEERLNLSSVGAFAVGSSFVENTIKRVKSSVNSKKLTAAYPAQATGVGAVQVDLRVSAEIDAGFTVSLTKGQKTSTGKFPDVVAPKGRMSAVYSGGLDGIAGTLNIRGMEEPTPFGVGVSQDASRVNNFVIRKDKRRGTVINSLTGEANFASSATTDTEGIAADIEITEGLKASITVHIRKANQLEMRRWEAGKALEDAERRQDYASLLAQISKARARFVDVSRIEQAEKFLKTLKPAPEDILTSQQLKTSMVWKKVTGIPEGHSEETVQMCPTDGCDTNKGGAPMIRDDEELTFKPDAVAEAFKGGVALPDGVGADQFLFEELVHAAASAPEGCVWRAGGKFILSGPNRNQAPVALYQLLMTHGRGKSGQAATAMKAIVDYTEKSFNARVTAIQTNFHPNHESYHAQHRDIFSSKQRGGMNCTCSFHTCVGTVCYSLGSSRRILCESCVDEMSVFEACCPDCQPCKKWRFLPSGSYMYFNDKWNNNHTHGIPACPEMPSGPRISIALLLA